ncbi:MAG: hypothetical protein JXB30_04580, partial [Anaerolineae bacterium]|nr:hypothetical protein [Anaerolineae bacterium]
SGCSGKLDIVKVISFQITPSHITESSTISAFLIQRFKQGIAEETLTVLFPSPMLPIIRTKTISLLSLPSDDLFG